MTDDLAQTIAVGDTSAVGEARRLARTMAGRLGFHETDVERVAIGVTEAATNVVKHAGSGHLVLVPVRHEHAPALAVLALDRGPGIADLERCMRDGYSTGGTPGTGLGAIRRQSEAFEVYAPRNMGTAVYALFRSRSLDAPSNPNPLPFTLGALRLAYPGETECGDLWALERTDTGVAIMVADGLGHGVGAADASRTAANLFRKSPAADPAEVLELAGAGMRHTRGAAVSIARVDPETRQLRYAGVGNVSGVLISGFGVQGLLGFSGIVGQEARKVVSNAYSWPSESVLVMFTDGLSSRWRPDEYPGFMALHPLLMAAVLLRDHRRARDDATVVVARWNAR